MPGTSKKTRPTESRRDELALAAFQEIAKSGFEGLRTRDVANAVGVNVATLHYYFPTKEDLIRAVVGFTMSRFQSTLAQEGTARERLQGHFRGLRRLSREEPDVFAVMAELWMRSVRDASLAKVIGKANEYWLDTLRTLIGNARSEGALPKEIEPDGMAAVVVATLRGSYLLPGRKSPEGIDRAIQQLERLLGLR